MTTTDRRFREYGVRLRTSDRPDDARPRSFDAVPFKAVGGAAPESMARRFDPPAIVRRPRRGAP